MYKNRENDISYTSCYSIDIVCVNSARHCSICLIYFKAFNLQNKPMKKGKKDCYFSDFTDEAIEARKLSVLPNSYCY